MDRELLSRAGWNLLGYLPDVSSKSSICPHTVLFLV